VRAGKGGKGFQLLFALFSAITLTYHLLYFKDGGLKAEVSTNKQTLVYGMCVLRLLCGDEISTLSRDPFIVHVDTVDLLPRPRILIMITATHATLHLAF